MSTTSEPASTSGSPTSRAPPSTSGSPQPTYTNTYTGNPDTTLYPTTSTSEIIPPTTSFDSTTTDSTTPIPSFTTTEPYPPSSTTTTTITTTTSSSTSTTWSYTRPTTTTSVGPTIPPTPPPSNDSGDLSTGAIVAIAVASVVGILALALSGFFIRRCQQRSSQRDSMHSQDPPPMQETRPNNHNNGVVSGVLVNNNNGGTGLGITSSSVNAPYSGSGFGISQDQMNAASLDTGGGYPSQSSGFGYDNAGSATALGAGLYGGYNDEIRYQQQAPHQPRSQQPYYHASNNQPLSYTPPTEPDIAPEDRYDPTYAYRQEQEAAYMNYQQQQLYLQCQQQLQQPQQQQELIQQQRQQNQQQYLAGQLPMPASVIPPPPPPPATTESFDIRPTVIGGGGGQERYYPENRFSVNSQTYLERLRGSYLPASVDQGPMRVPAEDGGAGSVVNTVRTLDPGLTSPLTPPMPVPVPPISSSHVGAGTAAGRTTGSEDYAYPESNARRVPNNDRWSTPPRPTSSTTDTPAVKVQADDQPVAAGATEGELASPLMANRFAKGEGVVTTEGNSSHVVSPKRSSVLSQESVSTASSGLNSKRLNSPQVISSAKRAPQARYPEKEPTITTIPREPL